MNERKYVAISIKHSIHDGTKRLVLWGDTGRTKDEEPRCFSGYTCNINKAELYSLEDFQNTYGNSFIKCDESVPMKLDMCKHYKKYDTVLVDIDEYKNFLSLL